MRPGCGEHSDPPRSPLEQLARRFLAPPSQGLRGLRMDEALERRQLDARPGASARGHVPTVPRLCPHPAHLRPSHIAATGCRSRPHGARMVSDGLRECGPQASNLRVARSSRAGRAKRDGHFWLVRVSSRPPTVPELCPNGALGAARSLVSPQVEGDRARSKEGMGDERLGGPSSCATGVLPRVGNSRPWSYARLTRCTR